VAVRDDLLAELEPALAARVLRAAVTAARPSDAPPTAAQVADLAELSVGAAVDLPDVTATRGGGWIALVPRDVSTPPVRALALPGTTRWEAANAQVEAVTEQPIDEDGQLRLVVEGGWRPPRLTPDAAALPPGAATGLGAAVLGPLPAEPVVRPRRPGDRVATAGGTRKLQDELVDAGVPRAVRDLVPVVAAGDRVLWVPGVSVDAELVEQGRRRPVAAVVVRTLQR
jgi:tRNA(Ile)-lysidine synthetase-like protein